MMSGKEFFVNRYEQLGWKFKEAEPRRAIRINVTNAKDKNMEKRLQSVGMQLEHIPFLETGYWIVSSKVSAGGTAPKLIGG